MRIQQLLNFMGLRQGQVARGLGLSEAHFSAICNGRRDLPIRLVTPLAQILGVTTGEVIAALDKLREQRK